jgi:hypothetical protein
MIRWVYGPRELNLVLNPILEQIFVQVVIFHPLSANSIFYPSLLPLCLRGLTLGDWLLAGFSAGGTFDIPFPTEPFSCLSLL